MILPEILRKRLRAVIRRTQLKSLFFLLISVEISFYLFFICVLFLLFFYSFSFLSVYCVYDFHNNNNRLKSSYLSSLFVVF